MVSAAAKLVYAVVAHMRSVRENGRILIALDEVRVGRSNIERFRSWLETFSNNVEVANHEYSYRKGGLITVVLLTSDALAAEAWQKVGGKVGWLLMWNLSRKDSEDLAGRLGIDVDRDLLWRLAEGNPRALGPIRYAGLEKWLASSIDKITSVLERHIGGRTPES